MRISFRRSSGTFFERRHVGPVLGIVELVARSQVWQDPMRAFNSSFRPVVTANDTPIGSGSQAAGRSLRRHRTQGVDRRVRTCSFKTGASAFAPAPRPVA